MQRFIPPIVLGVIILALFAVIQGTSAGLARDNAPERAERVTLNQPGPTPIWECIAIVHGDIQNDPIVLETANWGFDYVVVYRPEFFCETGFKSTTSTPPAGGGPVRILVCYSIKRGADPDDPIILDTANFDGNDGGVVGDDVDVRRSTFMCEEGTKARVIKPVQNPPQFQPPEGTLDTTAVWQCFTLERGEDPNVRRWLWTENFGVDEVTIRQSGLMCEPANKFVMGEPGTAGVITQESVLQCYRIDFGVKVEEEFLLLETNNFGQDRVQMRNGSMMCEDAVKTPFTELFGFDITLPVGVP